MVVVLGKKFALTLWVEEILGGKKLKYLEYR